MVKILLMSDSHWNDEILEPIIQKHKDEIDMIIHCGDIRMSEEELKAISPVPVYLVKGNNDFHSKAESEYLLEIEGHKCLVLHGHRQNIKESFEYLADYAKNKGADICFYGHTHIKNVQRVNGVLLMNPGSLEANDFGKYMIVEFNEDGTIDNYTYHTKSEFGETEDDNYEGDELFQLKKHIAEFFRGLFRRG